MTTDNTTTLLSRQTGNAALETMLLLPIILLILMLLINMGYNGIRHRQTQAGLRLGAFTYVDNLAEMDKNGARQSAQGKINQQAFPGETNAATLSVSGSNKPPAGVSNSGVLAKASYRQTVRISAKRTPPYDILPSVPLEGDLILAANTYTYCEMKDEDFAGKEMQALSATAVVGGYFLWLFGGCGGNTWDIDCKDACK